MVDFYRRHYGPGTLVIVIAGAVEAQEAFDQVQ
jgi:predicted Zn-dependent peptidase